PVVATPLISSISLGLISIVLEWDMGSLVGLVAAAGAEGEDHHADEEKRHQEKRPGIGELAQIAIDFHGRLPSAKLPARRSTGRPACRASANRRPARPFR